MNAVLYVERGKTKALATNSFASITANSKDLSLAPSTIENVEHGLELDMSHWTALDEFGTFLGVLKDGLIVMLRLVAPETGALLNLLFYFIYLLKLRITLLKFF
jgi:hypothetical protein